MPALLQLLCVSLALAGLLSVPARADDQLIASAIVIRHCARAPTSQWHCMGEGHPTDPNAYTGSPWPTWPVPPMMCTPRGIEIVQNQGRHYKATLPGQVTFIADDVQRDKDTAHALAYGMGLPNSTISVDGSIFDPTGYGLCERPSVDAVNEALREQMATVPKPPRYEELMLQLQTLMNGSTTFADIPTVIKDGGLQGGICAAEESTEALLLEYGAGLELGWGRLDAETLYSLLQLHIYYFVVHSPVLVSQSTESNLLYHLVNFLNATASSGQPATRFFVGHDTNVNGIANLLNMRWGNSPYPQNTTAPGSALRFDLYKTSVSGSAAELRVRASYVSTYFKTTNEPLASSPAPFADVGGNIMPFSAFQEYASKKWNPACTRS